MTNTEFTFTAVTVDDCSECGGQNELNAEHCCRWCAEEMATDPWCVIDEARGELLAAGVSREKAGHIVRVYSPGPWDEVRPRRPVRLRQETGDWL